MRYRNLVVTGLYIVVCIAAWCGEAVGQSKSRGTLLCSSTAGCIDCRLQVPPKLRARYKRASFSWTTDNPLMQRRMIRARWAAQFCGLADGAWFVRLAVRSDPNAERPLSSRFSQWVEVATSSDTAKDDEQNNNRVAIFPNSSGVSGGGLATIIGFGFTSTTTVKIGSESCSNLEVISSFKLTCTIPAGTVGLKNVVVLNDNSAPLVLSDGFTYLAPPVISLVTPAVGPTRGGQNIVVNGAGFVESSVITIGGIDCPVVSFTTTPAVAITCRTPIHTSGLKDVVVTNPDGQSDTLEGGYIYSDGMAPTISLVSPNYGPVAGGTTITVTGSQFMNGALAQLVVSLATVSRLSPLPHLPVSLRQDQMAPKQSW
jgi:hypothetical protein